MSRLGCSCHRVRRASRGLTMLYDQALSELGLTAVQMTVLTEIDRLSPISISQLAECLATERTAMSRTLKPMMAAGWINDMGGEDNRARYLVLTDPGRALLLEAAKHWSRVENRLAYRFGAEKKQQLWQLLEDLEDALVQE